VDRRQIRSPSGRSSIPFADENFSIQELSRNPRLLARLSPQISEADHVMAEAIRVVAGLYQDATLPKPKEYAYASPTF
jgi:hypothetical protein